MKICIVASIGGHLSEALQVESLFRQYEHFYILNGPLRVPKDMETRTYFISHSERDWRTLKNFVEAYRILRKERPDVVLSFGAGCAVPVFIVAGTMGIRRIFVETFAAIYRPSLTGRIIYGLGCYEHFFYQWRYLDRYYPSASCGGVIYDPSERR